MLVNLWASWCKPCLVELREFTDHQQQLQNAGIDIVALSVEDAGGTGKSGAPSAKSVLDGMSFPYSSGIASETLLENLQMMHDILFLQNRPLPAPSSFLVDRFGRVAAI